METVAPDAFSTFSLWWTAGSWRSRFYWKVSGFHEHRACECERERRDDAGRDADQRDCGTLREYELVRAQYELRVGAHGAQRRHERSDRGACGERQRREDETRWIDRPHAVEQAGEQASGAEREEALHEE